MAQGISDSLAQQFLQCFMSRTSTQFDHRRISLRIMLEKLLVAGG
jgi:hypothetical protein